MRLGMFMMPVHPPGRSLSDTLAGRHREVHPCGQARLRRTLDWRAFLSATTEPFPSPLMFLAGLVPQTKNLTFGTAVINPAQPSPRRSVAGEVAQFDHMSGGRFLFGIGSGGLASDFELFNIDPATRQRAFMESIDMILRIWSQDPPYDIQGETWNVQIKKAVLPELGVGFMPKPLQKPHPPIHISISSPDSASAKLAGGERLGHHLGDPSRRSMPLPPIGRPTAKPASRRASAPATRTGGCPVWSSWRRPTPKPWSASMAGSPRTAPTAPTCGRRWRRPSGYP